MDPFTLANEPPVLTLLGGAMQESRIPHQRHRNSTPIGEINNQSIIGNANILDHDWPSFSL